MTPGRATANIAWRLCLLFIGFFQIAAPAKIPEHYDLMVARDGSGDFTTVQAALNAVGDDLPTRTVIFIKAGVYKEKLIVRKTKQNVTLVGQNRNSTILSHHGRVGMLLLTGKLADTPGTSTIDINGRRFRAERLTFAYTAGEVGPALAVKVTGDQSRFINCRFLGYQDTLCTGGNRQYFKQCQIEGAVDFIFGSSTAVFDECVLNCRGDGFITAASTPREHPYGYVFRRCEITGDAAAESVYLGRPWSPYARTVFINCQMGPQIIPEGWDNWGNENNERTAHYAEYKNKGPGARPADRVEWADELSDEEVGAYTLKKIFGVNKSDPDLWYKD